MALEILSSRAAECTLEEINCQVRITEWLDWSVRLSKGSLSRSRVAALLQVRNCWLNKTFLSVHQK